MKNSISKTENRYQDPLEKWYSEILLKNGNDYSVEDICRMLRQDCMAERAAQIGKEFLKRDPFIGSLYDGELISAFIHDQKSYIYLYRKDFEIINSVAQELFIYRESLLDRFGDNESVEKLQQLFMRLDNILNGKEANPHLELIPQIISKHFELDSIDTNLLNPDYKWRRLPFLPIKFIEKNAKRDAQQLKRTLACFNGNCKWVLHRKRYLSKNFNLFILTIRGRHFPKMYKGFHKIELWEAVIKDIMPLAEHLKKTLAENDGK